MSAPNNPFGVDQARAGASLGFSQGRDWYKFALDPLNVRNLFGKKKEDHTASDTLARLYRDEWSDYQNRLAPLEQQELDLTSPMANKTERENAVSAVDKSYGQALPQLKQQAFSYGTSLTPAEEQSYSRRSNTQKALDETTAFNRTARVQSDRSWGNIPGGYVPGGSGIVPQSRGITG